MKKHEYLPKPLRRLLKHRRITENGCWEYTGYCNNMGYGLIYYKGSLWLAHRLSLFLHRPEEYFRNPIVMHICDNGKCFNPDHLKGGTLSDNNKDAWRKGHIDMDAIRPETRGPTYRYKYKN